tara:strand:- start:214 stop:459 length:246 start_codon:yes stop_codon:yes gene_type:complete
MSRYSSHTIKSDRVVFVHDTGHSAGQNVDFLTTANFNFKNPILLNNNYRLFVDSVEDKVYFQKKQDGPGNVFTNKFAFKFS